MSLVGVFVGASLGGWTVSSTAAYVGSVALSQITGAMWFSSVLFPRPWIEAAFPHLKTQEQREEYIKSHIHPAECYGSAMLGSTLGFLLLRGMIRLTAVRGVADGATIGVIMAGAGAAFGIMHPFFEHRSFLLYVINHGYHLFCFAMAGAIMASFQ